MASLKTFTQEDLLNVLSVCAHHLAGAYQETLEKELWMASHQAFMACEFLRFELNAQNKPYLIH